MSVAATIASGLAVAAPAAIDMLRIRAELRAFLWLLGEIDSIPSAVDELQAFAVASGLVKEIGQDAVQQILADAFLPYRKTEWAAQAASPELQAPAADDQLADHHQADDLGAAIWCGTCGRAPCTDPGFCAACREADRRLAGMPMRRFSWQPNEPDPGPRATPQVVIEALLYSVRERGTGALLEPENVERLGRCNAAATAEIERRMSKKLLEPTDASGS